MLVVTAQRVGLRHEGGVHPVARPALAEGVATGPAESQCERAEPGKSEELAPGGSTCGCSPVGVCPPALVAGGVRGGVLAPRRDAGPAHLTITEVKVASGRRRALTVSESFLRPASSTVS